MKQSVELILVVFFGLFSYCHPFLIAIDAHAEECFFDKVQSGTKLGLTFEVVEGGFLDIDVKITGPEGQEILTRERESNGKITFSATQPGTYTYCFSNKMSTLTPKSVMFSMNVGEPQSAATADSPVESRPEKLEEMINELSYAFLNVKHEQEYMEVRDKIHRKINESTNYRVVIWAFFETFILMAMTVSQAYYLKRFFEVRMVI